MIAQPMNFNSVDRYFVNDVTEVIIGGTVNENGTLNLSTPGGQLFTRVVFASFGTPNGTSPNFTLGGCHSPNSVSVVESLALGQSSVSIPATNATFGGDPCPGTGKRLYVALAYNVDNSGFRNLKNSGMWSLVNSAFRSLPSLFFSDVVSATGTTTTTHTCNAIGEGSNRLLIAAIVCSGATPSFISSVTIGGVTATRRAGRTAGDFVQTDFWSAIVPTGTSVDVVVTRNSGTNGADVVLISATGFSNTNWIGATDFNANNSSTTLMDVTQTYAAGSIIIGIYRAANIQGTATREWSGVNTLGSEYIEEETPGVNGAVAGDIRLNTIQYQLNAPVGSRTVSFTTSDSVRRRPSFAVIGFT